MGEENIGIDQCGEKTEKKEYSVGASKTLLFLLNLFFIDFVLSLLLYMTGLEKNGTSDLLIILNVFIILNGFYVNSFQCFYLNIQFT